MPVSPWLVGSLATAGIAALVYYTRDGDDYTPAGTLPEPEDPGFDPTPEEPPGPPEPPPPGPEGPGELAPGPQPEVPEAPEPPGGWQTVLTPAAAAGALNTVKDAAAASPVSTWATAVRFALMEVFPNNTWGGLLGGWKDDARAYMIQQLDVVADRAHWPGGDAAKEAARTFWLKSSKAIAECKGYNLSDTQLATCICELMFPASSWPAAGTAGEPWEIEVWNRTLTKAGIV